MADGVLIPSDELRAEVGRSLLVAADMNAVPESEWVRLLTPENDPRTFLRREYQRRNDCNANSGTTGVELLEQRSSGRHDELSRMMAYMLCEIIDGRLGADQGSSVPAFVQAMLKTGVSTEALFEYSKYTRSRRQFDAWCTPEVMENAATHKIAGSIAAPAFQGAKMHTALGNPIHWAHFWGLSFRTETIAPGVTARVCRRYKRAHGDSGHATEVVWPIKTPSGEWLLAVANSHNDGFFYIAEEAYEEIRDPRYTPYGAYVLLGHKDPVQQFTGQISWMGC